MISTQSRFHTAFGGAAGYLFLTFLLLLAAFHINQNFHFLPVQLPPKEPESLPGEIVKRAMPVPVPGHQFIKATPFKPSDLLPKPEEYANDIAVLKQRGLIFPLQGMARESMKKSFGDPRGGSRLHEGVDILAPRNTPVLAIEDGEIARLWKSGFGGITIYQFDPTNTYVYYYAHLEKYASNLKEGQSVHKGQVIGYVGTSGNAPPDTPHLHFAIYRAVAPGRWYHGRPLDPYPIFS